MKSPNQLEILLSKLWKDKDRAKKFVGEFTEKPEGGYIVAPLSDSRPAIDISPELEFEEFKDDTTQ